MFAKLRGVEVIGCTKSSAVMKLPYWWHWVGWQRGWGMGTGWGSRRCGWVSQRLDIIFQDLCMTIVRVIMIINVVYIVNGVRGCVNVRWLMF